MQKLSGATCLKELIHITEQFFWQNLSDVSVDGTCVRHWCAHNVGGSNKKWFTFFFLVNAQLLLGDITVGLRENFRKKISKNFDKFLLKLSPKLMPKIKLILSALPKFTLSGNFWPVRIFSVNFLTHDITFLRHGNNFDNSH